MSIMKMHKITLMFLIVGALAFAITAYSVQSCCASNKLTPLSEDEISSLIGAAGPFQSCGVSTSCPGPATCGGITCTQDYIEGFPVCLKGGSGGSGGCSGSGNYLDCEWDWCWWCSENGTDRCGYGEYPYCPHTGGLCLGPCDIAQTDDPCEEDCT